MASIALGGGLVVVIAFLNLAVGYCALGLSFLENLSTHTGCDYHGIWGIFAWTRSLLPQYQLEFGTFFLLPRIRRFGYQLPLNFRVFEISQTS